MYQCGDIGCGKEYATIRRSQDRYKKLHVVQIVTVERRESTFGIKDAVLRSRSRKGSARQVLFDGTRRRQYGNVRGKCCLSACERRLHTLHNPSLTP